MSTRNLSADSITGAVIQRMRQAKSARFKQVMDSLVKHLHDFARDVKLTEQEWEYAIDFLTRTGQKCDDKRQEFILLSDTLGLSTLITQMNHSSKDEETEQTVFGPFHRMKAPKFPLGANISKGVRGKPCFVSITVKTADGKPMRNATVDVWHSDAEGYYDVQHKEWKGAHKMRGVFKPDSEGRVYFWTIVPLYYPVPTDGPVGELLKASARHPMRPAHIHFLVAAPGYDRLVTHVFDKNDKYLDSDAVFGVRSSLIREYKRQKPGKAPDGSICKTPYWTVDYDFVMRPLPGKAKKKTAARKGSKTAKSGKQGE